MQDKDKKTLRKLSRIDELERKFFKHFASWTDAERENICLLIEIPIMKIDQFQKKKHKAKQLAENAKK